MTKKNSTYIAMVLDRSGSMQSVQNDTIGGVNRFLEEQKQQPGEVRLTLVTFNATHEVIVENAKLEAVAPLTRETYAPTGGTALCDAFGWTIEATGRHLAAMKEEERPAQVLFVVITDGEENASAKYTKDRIASMVRHQRETYSWEFVFLGANVDAFTTAHAYGIKTSNAAQYVGNAVGTANAFASASAGVRHYRSAGLQSAENFFVGAAQPGVVDPIVTQNPSTPEEKKP